MPGHANPAIRAAIPRGAPVRTGRLLLASAIALVGVAVGSRAASADYQGFSSSTPSGYDPAPGAWTVGTEISYSFTVTNDDVFPAGAPTGAVYAARITSVGSQDVSSGQPSMSEADVLGSSFTTEPAEQLGSLDQTPIVEGMPGSPQTFTVSPNDCGYLLIWAGGADPSDPDQVLNIGVTRVIGCPDSGQGGGPSPTARPTLHVVLHRPNATPTAPAGGSGSHSGASPSPSPSAGASKSPGSAGSGGGAGHGGGGAGGAGGSSSGGGDQAAPLFSVGPAGLPAGIQPSNIVVALIVLGAAGGIGAFTVLLRRGSVPHWPWRGAA
jgi:hypothetical protein